MDYWAHMDDYESQPADGSGGEIKYIRASDIEGIHIFETDLSDSNGFWGRRTGGTQQTFMDIAKQIPEVKQMIDSGMSLQQIRDSRPDLGSCVGIYFEGAPQVSQLGEFYIFSSNGRHRELAAQAINGVIPVRITDVIVQKKR